MIEGWRYYNHAAIPTCAPHEEPDTDPIYNGLVWTNLGGGYSASIKMDFRLGLWL